MNFKLGEGQVVFIDLDKEASIPLPIHIQEKVIIDNTDDEPTPEELGVPVSEVQNLHNED